MKKEHDSNQKTEPNNREESFSFLKETIKPETISREKLLMQFLRMAIYGLIIGLFACCSFFALKPWAEKTFGEKPEAVALPKDEELVLQENVEEGGFVLDEESYRQIMDRLYLTAQEAKKSIVSVRVKSKLDWYTQVEGSEDAIVYSAGILAAEQGEEILILADDKVCDQGTEWEVLLSDGTSETGILKMRDKNRGLAVFSIPRAEISEATYHQIQVAKFGNSNLVIQGDVVIGLGNMFGYEKGLGYGVASSVEYTEVFSDGQCGVIATDIATSQSGTGVLVNQKGEIVGLIRQGILRKNDPENPEVTANALGISDLKQVLELMLNGVEVPYAGIYGITVTAEIAAEQKIPEGLYVTQVEGDSPAMAAGIQNGDILQAFENQEVTGITTFENALLKSRVGSNVKIKGQRRGSNGYVDAEFTLNIGTKK